MQCRRAHFYMIIKVKAYVLHCTACGFQWIPAKDEVKVLRCPRAACRKLANYIGVKHENNGGLQGTDRG